MKRGPRWIGYLTLAQVAEEARFEPLWELIKPVEETLVNELGEDLRGGLLEDAQEIGKLTLCLMQAFLGACDARAKEAATKRAHVASGNESPGKQRCGCFGCLLFFFSFPDLSLAHSNCSCRAPAP